MVLEIICFIVGAWGIWLAIIFLAGVAGIFIPGPKQFLVGIPAIVFVVVAILAALSAIFGFCSA